MCIGFELTCVDAYALKQQILASYRQLLLS